jgi:hypothetical protein
MECMIRKSILIAALAFYLPASFAAELTKTSVLAGKVTLLIPQGFDLMSDDMRQLKYPNQARPPVVYTNAAGTINIAINHTPGEMPETSMPVLKSYLEGVLKNQYPTATWLRSEAVSRDGRKLVFYDFRAPALDTTIRNIMVAASLDGRLLLVSFNCTISEEKAWESSGKRIIDSIEIAK